MRFQTLPLLLSFVGCTVSTTMLKSAELWTCGTLSPSTQQVAQQKEIIALERLKRRESQAGINIDVYLHVIAKSKNASDGYLTVSQTLNISALNVHFIHHILLFGMANYSKEPNNPRSTGSGQ